MRPVRKVTKRSYIPSASSEEDETNMNKKSRTPLPTLNLSDDSSSESEIENNLKAISITTLTKFDDGPLPVTNVSQLHQSLENQICTSSSLSEPSDLDKNYVNIGNGSVQSPNKNVRGTLCNIEIKNNHFDEHMEIPTTSIMNFDHITTYNKNLEEAKKHIEMYKAKTLVEEKVLNVSNLLQMGERKIEQEFYSSLSSEDFDTLSDSDKDDWEEVEDNHDKHPIHKDVEVTINMMPIQAKKKKKVDLMAIVKRRINRIKKQNQVLVHKVHLLCWIAHGIYINKALKDQNLLAMALSLLPIQHCYSPNKLDLTYLENIVSWYYKFMENNGDSKDYMGKLDKLLQDQFTQKCAYNNKMFVYMFICILRSLGIKCRLVLSLQLEPLRPPASELCVVSSKKDDNSNKEVQQSLKSVTSAPKRPFQELEKDQTNSFRATNNSVQFKKNNPESVNNNPAAAKNSPKSSKKVLSPSKPSLKKKQVSFKLNSSNIFEKSSTDDKTRKSLMVKLNRLKTNQATTVKKQMKVDLERTNSTFKNTDKELNSIAYRSSIPTIQISHSQETENKSKNKQNIITSKRITSKESQKQCQTSPVGEDNTCSANIKINVNLNQNITSRGEKNSEKKRRKNSRSPVDEVTLSKSQISASKQESKNLRDSFRSPAHGGSTNLSKAQIGIDSKQKCTESSEKGRKTFKSSANGDGQVIKSENEGEISADDGCVPKTNNDANINVKFERPSSSKDKSIEPKENRPEYINRHSMNLDKQTSILQSEKDDKDHNARKQSKLTRRRSKLEKDSKFCPSINTRSKSRSPLNEVLIDVTNEDAVSEKVEFEKMCGQKRPFKSKIKIKLPFRKCANSMKTAYNRTDSEGEPEMQRNFKPLQPKVEVKIEIVTPKKEKYESPVGDCFGFPQNTPPLQRYINFKENTFNNDTIDFLEFPTNIPQLDGSADSKKRKRTNSEHEFELHPNIRQVDGGVDSDSSIISSESKTNLDKPNMPPERCMKSHLRRLKTLPKYQEVDSDDDFYPVSYYKKKNQLQSPKTSKEKSNLKSTSNPSTSKYSLQSQSDLCKGKRNVTKKDSDNDYLPNVSNKKSKDDFNETKIKRRVPMKKGAAVLEKQKVGEKEEIKNNKAVNTWIEVFVEAEKKWISVDVIKGKIHCVQEIYARASHPISYILSFDNDTKIKDITKRYCLNWSTITRKLRVSEEWWETTLKPYRGFQTARDREEDEDLVRQQLDQPLPTTISEYKDHPLYVLKRHLLKFQAIYPPDALTLGFIRNEPVYSRNCVYTLHSREIWVKHAKVVKAGVAPYKTVKARPKYDRLSNTLITDQPLDIFGPWQVEDYIPPTAENGVVPRNAYGNVELFKSCMLPRGTVHLQLPGLNKVARKLKIDCAPALVGFDFHGGWSHPTFDGFIVCEEFSEVLVAAYLEEEKEAEKRAQDKIEKRVYDNWKKLIRGLLIRERLKIRYDFGDPTSCKDNNSTKKKKGITFCTKKR